MTTSPAQAMTIHQVAGGAGLTLHVREWGNPHKPAILFIHGWSQNHLCWHRQFDSPLTENFRLVALDNRGHGMSAAPRAAASYQNSQYWADDIAAIIDALTLRPVLVGWSYGGLIICDYLRVHGAAALAGLNFVGATSELNEAAFGAKIGPGFLDNFADATASDAPTNIEAMKRFLHSCFEIPLERSEFETALAYNMLVRPDVRLSLGSRDLINDDVLAALEIPVLVSHGREDTVVLPAEGQHLIDHCPSAAASWYEGVGHAPFLEAPDRFNAELQDFVQHCHREACA